MSRSLGLSDTVIDYIRQANRPETSVMARCRAETERLGPAARMQISPEQGAVLDFLIRLLEARIVVEVGVFTGYSALWMGAALKDLHGEAGALHACDVDLETLKTAQGYWREAGLETIIAPCPGDARVSLPALSRDGLQGRVDFLFIDADKTGYLDYYEAGLDLLRSGGLMAFDNALWSGAVADPAETDADTEALRAVAIKVKEDPRTDQVLTAVGDGVLLARKH